MPATNLPAFRRPEVTLRCLSTGVVRGKARRRGPRRYLPGGWSEGVLPVNVFLVSHPEGVLLFDAGQEARAARPGYFPWWYPFFRLARFELEVEDQAGAQLKGLGHDPAEVTAVVLSHLHTDHAGGVGSFATAEVLVSRDEWLRATDLRARMRLRGYLPQHWPASVSPTLVDFHGPPLGPFNATHDLTGDRRLLLVPTPGHTPGHMSLFVRADWGSCLLAGDMAETPGDLARAAPEVEAWCRHEGVTVLTSHDREATALVRAISTRTS